MKDILIALVVFSIVFLSITAGNWALAIILGLISVVMFMPTADGIFYSYIAENLRFIFSKKKYTKKANKDKENIDVLVGIKGIKDNGTIEYQNSYGRVVKIGQKNFGIEDVVQQNIDINYFANALKLLDGMQSADIVKIDRPVKLDDFSAELFEKYAFVFGIEPAEVLMINSAPLQKPRREIIDNISRNINTASDYELSVIDKLVSCFVRN